MTACADHIKPRFCMPSLVNSYLHRLKMKKINHELVLNLKRFLDT